MMAILVIKELAQIQIASTGFEGILFLKGGTSRAAPSAR